MNPTFFVRNAFGPIKARAVLADLTSLRTVKLGKDGVTGWASIGGKKVKGKVVRSPDGVLVFIEGD